MVFAPQRTRRAASLATALALGLGALFSTAAVAAVPAAAFPVTLSSPAGTVHLATRPTRIVSLSPTATEMLFKLGAGAQVIAVDDDSDYPSSAPRTTLSGLEPNIEAIAKYRPDLVVIDYNPSGFARKLIELHIPVLVEPAVQDLAGTYAQLTELGRATGHRASAARVIAVMRAQIASIGADAPHFSTPVTYYYELDQTYYSATSSTFIGQLLKRLHMRDIADRAKGAASGYPELSAEYIVKADPQMILLADTRCCYQSDATVARRAGWGAITAVRDDAVVPLNDDVASRWGPRVVTLLRSVEKALWTLKSRTAT